MTNTSKKSIIRELRALVPTRPLTLSESYALAEQQAATALGLVGSEHPHVDLGWVVDLPRVEAAPSPD